jgi:HK97 family phage portal protein
MGRGVGLGAKLRSMFHFGHSGGILEHVHHYEGADKDGVDRAQMARKVGNGTAVSVVMSVVQWVQRAWAEAPPIVVTVDEDGELDYEPGSRAAALLLNPNPAYGFDELFAGVLYSWMWAGNCYLLKIRNGLGKVVEIWWVPHWMIRPRWPMGGGQFISHYEYTPGNGATIDIDPADVIHLRSGMDPKNPRLGLSQIQSALPELFVDITASEMSASLVNNHGVPGLVVSPDSEDGISEPQARDAERRINAKTRGGNRGRTIVMTGRAKVSQFGFDPSRMGLDSLHDIAEERVCSLTGVPSAVVGFSAGLEQTRVGASMTELRKLAWANCVIPNQRQVANQLTRQLLREFDNRENAMIVFDLRKVEALKESRNELVERVDKAIQGGWLTVAKGKTMVGIEPEPGDDVYLRRISVIEVPASVGRRETEGGDKVRGVKGLKHEPSALESRVIRDNPKVTPTRQEIEYADALLGIREDLQTDMQRELVEFFSGLGPLLTDAAGDILRQELAEVSNRKQDINIDDLTARMMAAARVADQQPIFREIYERHYLRVGEAVARQGETIGLGTDLPDPVARAITATGGRRAGLIDLDRQTHARLFQVLTDTRAEGLGADQTMRRIRDEIPAGPWSSTEVRGRVIARTETMYARNVSALERAKGADVQRVLIFDAVLGDTDETCMALDGREVSMAEAEELMDLEHPNGTRSFVPRM